MPPFSMVDSELYLHILTDDILANACNKLPLYVLKANYYAIPAFSIPALPVCGHRNEESFNASPVLGVSRGYIQHVQGLSHALRTFSLAFSITGIILLAGASPISAAALIAKT